MTKPQLESPAERFPLAYLITFRSYGTWLHGRAGSVDRFHNIYGAPTLPANEPRRKYNLRLLKHRPVMLNALARTQVELAIRETCNIRGWLLWAFNVRTNHVHTVVSAKCKPDGILSAFKANATRKMKEVGCWAGDRTPWVRRGSKRWLWTKKDLNNAIDYVLYGQGLPLP